MLTRQRQTYLEELHCDGALARWSAAMLLCTFTQYTNPTLVVAQISKLDFRGETLEETLHRETAQESVINACGSFLFYGVVNQT
jgi:hypothetical protein